MADETGAVFTQSGVPVQGSADYQRVYDSRVKFMEIEKELDVSATFEALDSFETSAQQVLFRHGLGFVPAFDDGVISGPAMTITADRNNVYAVLQATDPVGPQTCRATVRIYNIPILQTYEAPKGLPEGTQSTRSNFGIKFLDGSANSVDVGDDSDIGFSIDTTKKALSIHKHGFFKINDWALRSALVTAIDVNTNILTVAIYPYNMSAINNIDWLLQPGAVVTSYFPGSVYNPNTGYYETGSYPGGISNGTYYSIPVDSTHIKLASTYNNAINNIPIDITSTGTLPANFGSGPSGQYDNAIFHDVGYPPTYMLFEVTITDLYRSTGDVDDLIIGPRLRQRVLVYTTADNDYLYFKGVQAVFGGWFGCIILKDPAEIAR